MAQAAQNPVVQQQKVVVPNKYGEKLVGLLHDTGSAEIVILCHGFRSNKEHTTMVNLAVALEKEGISAFRFDFAGNGESEGTFEFGNYKKEADDIRAVIEHFSGANRKIGGILGHSKGGGVVLLYASKYHDVRTVVNVSGRYDLKKGIVGLVGEEFMEKLKEKGYVDVKDENSNFPNFFNTVLFMSTWDFPSFLNTLSVGNVSYRVTYESMMDRLNTDMHAACLEIDKECRVLTIHGSADEIIPVEDALEFAKIIPNHKLHIIEGADHCYTSNQAELASTAVDFIKAALEQDKAASS